MLLLFLLLVGNRPSSCELPLSVIRDENGLGRGELVQNYFLQDYTSDEIVGFLALRRGIVVSIQTVKRIRRGYNVRRARREESTIETVVHAMLQELENSCGSFGGYRQLTQRMRRKYNLKVKRDNVMNYLRIIDPAGVECRKRRHLKRRRYTTPGPNFMWHIDSWYKPSPYGFTFTVRSTVIQGAYYGWRLNRRTKIPKKIVRKNWYI